MAFHWQSLYMCYASPQCMLFAKRKTSASAAVMTTIPNHRKAIEIAMQYCKWLFFCIGSFMPSSYMNRLQIVPPNFFLNFFVVENIALKIYLARFSKRRISVCGIDTRFVWKSRWNVSCIQSRIDGNPIVVWSSNVQSHFNTQFKTWISSVLH